MIEIAESHNQFKNLHYQQINGKDLSNFSTKSFDFILSLITLHHSPPKIQYNLLKEMMRVLNSDGVMVISVVTHMNLSNTLRNVLHNINPELANYLLKIWQKIKGQKMGHYDVKVSSMMFPVSKRKIQTILRKFGVEFKYVNTVELNFKEDSKLELFIIRLKN